MLAIMHDENADADRRDRMAMASAPYIHPRLHSVEAKQETTVVIASAEELRERARQAIREAFQEREVLTGLKVIEHDDGDGTALHATTRHSIAHHDTAHHDTATVAVIEHDDAELNDAGLNSDDS